MTHTPQTDRIVAGIRVWAASSGLSQQQLGELMGYPPASAKASVSKFLRASDHPLSVLERFAGAIGSTIAGIAAGLFPPPPQVDRPKRGRPPKAETPKKRGRPKKL